MIYKDYCELGFETMISKLNDPQIETALGILNGWTRIENRHAIEKHFKFKDFAECWAFMNRVATLAEDMDHHPEWSNIYNRVHIILTTHDADGISERDIRMATTIDQF